VDFLFSLLALPVELLGTESMAGCIGNVYASVEALDEAYVVQPGAAKGALLHPTTTLSPAAAGAAALQQAPCSACRRRCHPTRPARRSSMFHPSSGSTSFCGYVTDLCGLVCPSCRGHMGTEVTLLSSAEPAAQPSAGAATGGESGFVRGVVTYTVMDDLTVKRMSTISGITLLNTFGVTDIGVLQERIVQLGYAEVINHS